MPSIAKFLGGGKKPPQVVQRNELPELVRQLREHGTHHDRPVATTIREARGHLTVKQGARGEWMVYAVIQGCMWSDSPVRWMAASNGMAWIHAAAGWWPTEGAAKAALEAAVASVYADEIAAKKAGEERLAALESVRDQFAPRLRAIEERRIAAGLSGYPLYLALNDFSLMGPSAPYSEEAVTAAEARVAAGEQAKLEAEAFQIAAPVLVTRLTARGVQAELRYDGVYVIVNGCWRREFPNMTVGLAALEAYVVEKERPVETKSLNLSGLFGGVTTRRK